MFDRALDTLLMHHVSLGVIWIVAKCPSELLGLNQKHVSGRACVVSRVPDAPITVLLELIVTNSLLKNLEIGASPVFLPWGLGRSGCCEQTLTYAASSLGMRIRL